MVSKNTKKILNYLLRNLDLKNINQISRNLKISVGSSFKILKELEKNNVLLVENIGNAKYYSLNFKSIEAKKLCELLLIEERRNLKGYSKIYADEVKNFESADLIILFGSILEKEEFNDVDVLFVNGPVKKVTNFCLDISKTKSKPVSPLILKKHGLINEIKNKKESILNIVKKGIVLKGESVFVEVMENVRL